MLCDVLEVKKDIASAFWKYISQTRQHNQHAAQGLFSQPLTGG